MQDYVYEFALAGFRCHAIASSPEGNRNVLLVETRRELVLVDTGGGFHDPQRPSSLLDNLAAVGKSPESIGAVVLSHADFDHIGGTIENGQAIFPNARHFLSRVEAEFWARHPDRLRKSELYSEEFRHRGNSIPPVCIDSLGGLVELVEFGTEVVPGIRMLAAPGHTPGNTIVEVASGTERLLCVADLFYQPDNIADPNWVAPYDYDPDQVVLTRRRILSDSARDRTLLMVYHLPFPGLGRVYSEVAGWKWQPAT